METLPQLKEGKARDEAGEAFGVSGKQVDKARVVVADKPIDTSEVGRVEALRWRCLLPWGLVPIARLDCGVRLAEPFECLQRRLRPLDKAH